MPFTTVLFFKCPFIDKCRKNRPCNRTHPVQPDMLCRAAHQRGAEMACRVHCSSANWTSHKNIQRDGQSYEQPSHLRGAAVNGSAVHNEHEKERQDCFSNDPLTYAYAVSQFRCPHMHGDQ